jgi:hypothetical protein
MILATEAAGFSGSNVVAALTACVSSYATASARISTGAV